MGSPNPKSLDINRLISESTIYEVNFDLWGFSCAWIDTIENRLLGLSCNLKDSRCESYSNPACQAVRFQSTNKEDIEKAKALFKQLVPLAGKTYPEKGPDAVYYDSAVIFGP